MTFHEFYSYHRPGLEADEIRFNVQISVMAAAAESFPEGFEYWTLGEPGHCAIRSPGRSILLGALGRDECRELARQTKDVPYAGVMGSGGTAGWFVEEAGSLGIAFGAVDPQSIQVLDVPPRYPGAEGQPGP